MIISDTKINSVYGQAIYEQLKIQSEFIKREIENFSLIKKFGWGCGIYTPECYSELLVKIELTQPSLKMAWDSFNMIEDKLTS